ncbi:MAG TPA: DUF4097 family beta strand repeat-containing protein [Propionibacteriaceae bacterium]|nr:DUF4097 family beta strand repeat-containing protein [Propionibacteriaceae bacterium]
MTTTTQTHTIEYVLDGLPQLRLKNHKGDIRVFHDAGPGTVSVRLHSHRPVSFDDVSSSVDGTTVTIDIPQLTEADSGTGFTFRIAGISLFAGFRGPTVDAEVHLPSGADIALETGYGDITVSGVSGEAAAKTGAGDVDLPEAGRVTLSSGAGNVRAGRISGGTLRTGAGDVSIDSTSSDTDVNSGTGDVTLLDAVGTVRINTGAGDVNASVSEGRIDVRSGMGDIIVRVPVGMPVWQELSTGMGEARSRIAPQGEPEPGEPYLSVTARSGAGDVTLAN